jgi:hypothetical protein
MRPALTVLHLHLHLHENASDYRARRTQRMIDSPAYRRACRDADLEHYADLMRMADRADDPHLLAALLKIAKRARAEIADTRDARNVIHDCALAVERATVRKIGQMRRLSSER